MTKHSHRRRRTFRRISKKRDRKAEIRVQNGENAHRIWRLCAITCDLLTDGGAGRFYLPRVDFGQGRFHETGLVLRLMLLRLLLRLILGIVLGSIVVRVLMGVRVRVRVVARVLVPRLMLVLLRVLLPPSVEPGLALRAALLPRVAHHRHEAFGRLVGRFLGHVLFVTVGARGRRVQHDSRVRGGRGGGLGRGRVFRDGCHLDHWPVRMLRGPNASGDAPPGQEGGGLGTESGTLSARGTRGSRHRRLF